MDGTQRVFGPLRSRRKSSFSCPLGHHLSPVLFMMSDDELFVPHKVRLVSWKHSSVSSAVPPSGSL